MIKLAVRALRKIKGLTSQREIITVASAVIYEHAFFFFSITHWITVRFINSPHVNNCQCGGLKEQAPQVPPPCLTPRQNQGGQRQTKKTKKTKQKHITGRTALSLLSEMFSSLYTDVTKKTVRETLEQKAEVVGPRRGAVMVLRSPPEGFMPAQGGTEQELLPCG